MLIGKRIKELRENKNMTLTELSNASGVQIATLSRMENLKMTGTIESHMSIAKALGADLLELYRETKPSAESSAAPAPAAPAPASPLLTRAKTGKTAAESFTYNALASYEILTTNLLSKKMMPIILRIEPGGKTNMEQNIDGSERFIFILEGEITVRIAKEIYTLKSNSSLYFDASHEHHFENKGKKPAKILSVTTPVML